MTVESLQANGQMTENEGDSANSTPQGEHDTSSTDRGASALSVKERGQGLNLARRPASMLPGNRPIEPSHLKVIDTYSSVGAIRPIAASGMEIAGTLKVSGNRPISSSHLKVSQTYTVMGNRPVASNETEDPANLLGYLD